MADDTQEILGTWVVKFKQWTWEYVFTSDGRVAWRDPLNQEKGAGRWSLLGQMINLAWAGSSTKETWNRPVQAAKQTGWYVASYGSGVINAKKAQSAQSISPAGSRADGNPVLIPAPESIIPKLDPRTTLFLGGTWGEVKAGQTWTATDGSRLIWSADGLQVVFSVKNRFFAQSASGFRGEVTTYPLVEAARRAAPMARLAEIEMKLLMGLVAGSSGAGFAAVIGTEVLAFVAENKDNFAKWNQQLQAVLEVRAQLKGIAPTLYDKVFNAVLKQLWKDVKSQLPEAVTAETVAFAVGVVIGSAGKAATKGKFTALGVLVVVLEQIVIRFSLNVMPEAIKLTSEEYAKLAKEIIGNLKTAGVAINDGDIKKIVDEVYKHPKEIKAAFEKLRAAFNK